MVCCSTFITHHSTLITRIEQLEVEGPLVGGQRQEDDPLALDGQERLHTVGTHIGGHGDGVEVEVAFGVEEGTGIALAGVADVAALGVGNGEDGLAQLVEIVHGELELAQTLDAEGLVEGQIGLVGHTVVDGGIDDGTVEAENAVLGVAQMLGHLGGVGVEADAEERLSFSYQADEVLSIHGVSLFFRNIILSVCGTAR